jgi:hypothetical protein
MNSPEYLGLNFTESEVFDIYRRREEARLSLANPARTPAASPQAQADGDGLEPELVYERRRQEARLSLASKERPTTRIPAHAPDDLGGLAMSIYERRRSEVAGKRPPPLLLQEEPAPAPVQPAAPAVVPPVQTPAPAMPARSQAAPAARLSNGAAPGMAAIAGGRVQWGAAA